MKEIHEITYFNVDECIENLKEEKLNLTKDELYDSIKKGELTAIQVEEDSYISWYDLRFYLFIKQQPDLSTQIESFGGLTVDLSQLEVKPKILDIGGGGEGIIGQLFKDNVIAIDPLKSELEEAPEGPIKIVMNAKELLFIDHSFHSVTAFFTFMYIEKDAHKKIFEEIYRVLKPGGAFYLWDTIIPEYKDGDKAMFLLFLNVILNDKTVSTGYGHRWQNKLQNIDYFMALGKDVGFEVEIQEKIQDSGFFIEFKK